MGFCTRSVGCSGSELGGLAVGRAGTSPRGPKWGGVLGEGGGMRAQLAACSCVCVCGCDRGGAEVPGWRHGSCELAEEEPEPH